MLKPERWRAFSIIATIALVIQSGILFLALFEPPLPYIVPKLPADDSGSEQFVRTLQVLTGAYADSATKLEVLTNGENYYPRELEAIKKAQRTINLEAYIFEEGEVARQFVSALAERARAGVQVKVLLDAVGSAATLQSYFKELEAAGGRVAWYHPLRWYTWPRVNYRTHRELIIVDGQVGFIGGAGFADHWLKQQGDEPRWRDTMVYVEGGAVVGLQAAFAENWLEASGEILAGRDYFRFTESDSRRTSLVVGSAPTTGRSTPARVLIQTLIASAKSRIYLTSPYFLPDRSLREELARAVRERGVDVRIVAPGRKIDHEFTRSSSRRLFGSMLEAGVKIYEYQPAMIHTKSLVVDGRWGVVGSTNMDSRSFGINDEVNLAVLDDAFAARLEQDFHNDVRNSRQITYEQWQRRGARERVSEILGSLFERQQ